ncbi:BD1L1-like protein [Mya arenaria]|uniref:BD1L1-like protein n=1 Tax=Mya arenaria TaxID=6604 RepID=A0ABY7FJ90_MYAAR|nr:BD1L1-like protein [Mya arenaria]
MTAGSSKGEKADPEVVEKIIQELKSKGYFDQFRKEFVADADTKRVESYVGRYLSQQTWSPNLNKNQLRENLRRQINQTGMLNKGVERIVEQIVNPKIMQLIKPRTDEVTCDFLGISLTEHKNALKKKQQEHHEQLLKSPDTPGQYMNLQFSSPPPGSGGQTFTNTSSPALPPGQFLLPTTLPPGQFNPAGLLGQGPGQQTGSSFPTAPTGLTFPTGISQQNFPFLPQGWNASLTAGFPPMFNPSGQLTNPFQGFPLPPPGAGITVPPPAAAGIIPGLTPASLPTPSGDLIPGMTLYLPDSSHMQKKKSSDDGRDEHSSEGTKEDKELDLEDMKVVDEYVAEGDISLEDIPMPEGETDDAEKAVNEQIRKAFHEELAKAKGDGTGRGQTGISTKRPYKFAWNEDIQEVELEDSDVLSDVSSVHTSDLSNFDESENSDADMAKEKEIKQSLEAAAKESQEAELVSQSAVSTDVAPPPEPSPVKTALPTGQEAAITADTTGTSPATSKKPRKLVSLQYNFSDSEDEESREERKARIAKEKEERYQKRLQRRAELETKRKEREEEKLRHKLERAKAKEEEKREARGKQEEEDKKSDMEKMKVKDEEDETDKKNGIEKNSVIEKNEAEEKKIENGETCAKDEEEGKVGDEQMKIAAQKDDQMTEVKTIVKDEVAEVQVKQRKEVQGSGEEIVENKTEDEKIVANEEVAVENESEETSQKDNVVKSNDVDEKDVSEIDEKSAGETEEKSENVSAKEDTKLTETLKEKSENKQEMVKEETGVNENNEETALEKQHSTTPDAEIDVYKQAEITEDKAVDSIVAKEEHIESNAKSDKQEKVESDDKTDVEESEIGETKELSNTDKIIEGTDKTIEDKPTQVAMIQATEEEGEEKESEEVTEANTSITTETSDAAEDVSAASLDTSVAESHAEVENSGTDSKDSKDPHDTSMAESEFNEAANTSMADTQAGADSSVGEGSSPDKKERKKKKTKEELKAELKEQKYEYKEPGTNLSQGYGDMMVIEETVEMEIETDPNTIQLVEIPLPEAVGEGEGQAPVTMETVEFTEIAGEGELVTTEDGETYILQTSGGDDIQYTEDGTETYMTDGTQLLEVTQADTTAAAETIRVTRSRSKVNEETKSTSSEVSDQSGGGADSRRKRKRHGSHADIAEPVSKKSLPTSQAEGRQLRSNTEGKYDRAENKSRKSYNTNDLYKPRHSFSRKSLTTPPPLPSEPPPPPKESSPPPLPPLPPPPTETNIAAEKSDLPLAPASPSGSESSHTTVSSKASSKKRKRESRSKSKSKSRSPKRSRTADKSKDSKDSEAERRRKARPVAFVDFGEAAKRARQQAMIPPPFGPRGPVGPLGPRPPLGPLGPRGPMPPGYGEDDFYAPDEGPGKTGVTKRGTLYREDTSPSPPPERRPMYSPPPVYLEDSLSPPTRTGVTERGTLYREDASPSPPPVMHRRYLEHSPSPEFSGRMRRIRESLTPSPPPLIARRRTHRESRTDSYESISPSPPPHGLVARRFSPSPPLLRDSPPVLHRNRAPMMTGTPSPPSSGELTPSPPDLRGRGKSPVSPGPLGPVSPLTPMAGEDIIDSDSEAGIITEPSPPVRKSKRKRRRDVVSPASSTGEIIEIPVVSHRKTRKQSVLEAGEMQEEFPILTRSQRELGEPSGEVRPPKSKSKKKKKHSHR